MFSTLDDAGELLRGEPRKAEMMAVRVRGAGSVAASLAPWPVAMEIPVGCTAEGLLGHLAWRDPVLRLGRLAGTLVAVIGGEVCDPSRVILPGEDITVRSTADDLIARQRPWARGP